MKTRCNPAHGLTLIELMVVVALVALLVLLAAPSFQDMILIQRLRGVNAQLVTDLQFARSEAVARGQPLRINLGQDAQNTCYTLFISAGNGYDRCTCTLGVGSACTHPLTQEIKTIVLPRSNKVLLDWTMLDSAFGFDHITGGLISIPSDTVSSPLVSVSMTTRIDDDRRLRTTVIQSGRTAVCAPNAQRMQVPAC